MVDINKLSSGDYWKHLGMTLEWEADTVVVKMAKLEETTQVYGNIHGGALAGLVDSAIAVAINRQLPENYGAFTVEMKINYLRPAKGELVARGKVIQKGKKIIVGQGEAFDQDGKMVAYGTATFMVIPPEG
ncbi:MAG: PaaI family thioesterase [Clostridia bacterium]|jgi:acyl-CoA thioesterase|nr:PaaI family thioesterase [Clostridia bacterium]